MYSVNVYVHFNMNKTLQLNRVEALTVEFQKTIRERESRGRDEMGWGWGWVGSIQPDL